MADRALLIVNTRSRSGRDLFTNARHQLAERGIALDDAFAVRQPERLPEIVRDAVRRRHPLVVVGGGDGTISSVVDYLAHSDTALGVLPLGTANSFARTLGIPLDLKGAIGVIADGKVARVDLGRVGGDLFANAAAIGLPSVINAGIPLGLKRRLGRLGYLIYGAYALLTYRPFRCEVASARERHSLDALEVRVVNGSYLGGILVAEAASVESEDIVVQVITGTRRSTLVDTWFREARGVPLPPGRIETFRAREFAISTEPVRPVSIDGEVLTRTPIRCSVARQALRVMVPTERVDLD